MEENKIYSIKEIINKLSYLPDKVNNILPDEFKNIFIITGMITKILDWNGHKYITLTDNKTLLKCFCKSSLTQIITLIKEGINITFKGYLTFKYNYRLYNYELEFKIIDIINKKEDKTYKDNLINQCKELNLFENKKEINWNKIKRIGLLSKNNTHGYNDFMTHISKIKNNIFIKLYEIILEGQNTEKSLIECINNINNNNKDNIDIIIICRGGGLTENISLSYDNLNIFQCIKNSKIPICTAIGHSDDKDEKLLITNISDYDFTTPTNAGDFIYSKYINKIINKFNLLNKSLNIFKELILNLLLNEINNYKNDINYIKNLLINKYNYININNNDNNIIIYNNKQYKLDINKLDLINLKDKNVKINELINNELTNEIMKINKTLLNKIKSNKKLYNYCLKLYNKYYINKEIYELYECYNEIYNSINIYPYLEKYNLLTNEIIKINKKILKYNKILDNLDNKII